MNYNFYKKKIDTTGSIYFMVKSKNNILCCFNFTIKEAYQIQEIIEGIEKNRTLAEDKDPYVWGNEDVSVFANKIGVLLIDKLAFIAGQEATPLELTHDDMITFLKDFKKFVAENS